MSREEENYKTLKVDSFTEELQTQTITKEKHGVIFQNVAARAGESLLLMLPVLSSKGIFIQR